MKATVNFILHLSKDGKYGEILYAIENIVNKIICGNSLDVLRQIPSESVNTAITSPPYWGLRSYKTPGYVWDGDTKCEHDFTIDTKAGDIRYRPGNNCQVSNNQNYDLWDRNAKGHICSICGAWMGELGHEPTPELYISHLCKIFDKIKRILKPEGSLYVNIGDTYYGSGGSVGHTPESKNLGRSTFEYGAYPTASVSQKKHSFLQAKSQTCIPEMFVLEMVKRGWIKRNTIIWHKKNCMPESVDDRFTRDFEPMYYFTKNNKILYWTNENSLNLSTRKPKTNIEGLDWELRPCRRCSGTGYTDVDNEENNNSQCTIESFFDENDGNKYIDIDAGNKIIVCKSCSGTGKAKYPLWVGHDSYFEQQFEPYNINRWGGRFKKNDKVKTHGTSILESGAQKSANRVGYDCYPNPLGRNKRSVWDIKVASFKGAHFAVYPEELLITPIKAGCPEYVCTSCWMPRIKIYRPYGNQVSPQAPILTKESQEKELAGYSSCDCANPEYLPGIVLDPFIGSGTTGIVALKLGRRFIGIDSNQKYVDMAMERIKPYLEQKTLNNLIEV